MSLGKKYIKELIILILLFFSCGNRDSITLDTHALLNEAGFPKKLRVVTDYNSTNYFVYKGQPMGFQYELLCELADYLGTELEVTVNNDLEEKFDLLNHNEIDLIAINLTVTEERSQFLDFTLPHSYSHQVLVQRLPDNYAKLNIEKLDSILIRNPRELEQKTVYVQKNSSHAKRITEIICEFNIQPKVKEVDVSVEKLISWVSEGKIDYTICDNNVGNVNQAFLKNIDINTSISNEEDLAWAVKKGNTELLNELNKWLDSFTQTARFAVIYKKYFNSDRQTKLRESDYFAMFTGRVSQYDDIIKASAEKIDWDWKLLASLIYQESRFNPHARSWAGAYGLMQFMPGTGKRYGITPSSSPSKQIYAGTRFLSWLDNQFSDIRDEEERLKFVLASYNVGPGHVKDARNLARKYGYDPDKWENNVEQFILSKSEPQFFTDEVVQYGYCRGTETVNYVADILERYEHYKNIIPN